MAERNCDEQNMQHVEMELNVYNFGLETPWKI
jgi:hypothetical protein